MPKDEALVIEERETWLATERWLLSRGLDPAFAEFRTKDPVTGQEQLNEDAIISYVQKTYGEKSSDGPKLPSNLVISLEPEHPWSKLEPFVIWQCNDDE
jgi:hypothetical protein